MMKCQEGKVVELSLHGVTLGRQMRPDKLEKRMDLVRRFKECLPVFKQKMVSSKANAAEHVSLDSVVGEQGSLLSVNCPSDTVELPSADLIKLKINGQVMDNQL